MNRRLALSWSVLTTLTGCASIVSGVDQPISVETRLAGAPVVGVGCTLSSNKGTWFVTTPGSLVVHRGFQDMNVVCVKPGLDPSTTQVASHVRPIAFGNILFGGIIGVAVDTGDGAAFDYPDLFTVHMTVGPVAAASTASTAAGIGSVVASVPPDARDDNAAPLARGERRYQVTAEQFAQTHGCVGAPATSTLVARGAGYETYSVACATGRTLVARCEFGQCRVAQ